MDKRIQRSLIVKYMLMKTKGWSNSETNQLQNASYWRCHDMPSYNFNYRARLQFAQRQKASTHEVLHIIDSYIIQEF